MVGDWIKIRSDLYRDPKVCLIADCLLDNDGELARYVSRSCGCDMAVTRNVMRNVTVGALVAVWGVTRHRGKRDNDDLFLRNATLSVVDDIADLPGFGDAMAAAGWVIENDLGIVFPNFFEEFNSDPTEEARKRNADRQRRYREKQRNVTVTSQSNVREEKSREEKNNKKPPKSPKGESFNPKVIGLPFQSDTFRAAWELWCDNRTEIKKPLKPIGTSQQLKKLAEMGEARAIAAIEHSVANQYHGIYEPSATPASKAPAEPESPQRTFYIAGVTNVQKGNQS